MTDDPDETENDGEAGRDSHEAEPDEIENDGGEVLATGRERRSVPAGLFILAVVVAGVFGVLAAIALVDDDSGDESTSSSARTAAGDYAERFLALSHDSYDAWLDDMRAIGTAGFAESVGRRENELRTLLSENQVAWQGRAIEVYIADSGGGIVSAVVLYDLEVVDQQGSRVLPDQYLRIDLVEGQAGWLVERVLSITSDASALVAGAGSTPANNSPAPTTTTDPDG